MVVGQQEFRNAIEQINAEFARINKKLAELEEQMAQASKPKTTRKTTKEDKST